MTEQDLEVRVRYNECDPMGVAHHSAYPVWLEIARTDMLRRSGRAYCQLEEQGIFFVVVRLTVRYLRPARYDDILRVRAAVSSGTVKIEHEYTIHRSDELIAEALTTLACVDRNGRPQRIPPGVFDQKNS
jgi:acyl-CoA thioester hydrolase